MPDEDDIKDDFGSGLPKKSPLDELGDDGDVPDVEEEEEEEEDDDEDTDDEEE